MVAYSATKYTCKRHPLRWRREQAMAIIEAACADSLPCKVEGFGVWGGGWSLRLTPAILHLACCIL